MIRRLLPITLLTFAYMTLTTASPNPNPIPLAGFIPPKTAPKAPNEPDVPSTPHSPDNPLGPRPGIVGTPGGIVPGSGSGSAGYIPSNEVIQSHLGSLEGKLSQNENSQFGEETGKTRAEKVHEVIEIVGEIIDAVGGQGGSSSSSKIFVPYTSSSSSRTSPTAKLSSTYTPTTILPSSSFAACTSYAKRLSSCASATTSFYSLAATVQASCACYSTPATSLVCTGTKEAQVTAAPTLAISAFDNVAKSCAEYVGSMGYVNVARGLDAQGFVGDGTLVGLGVGFCAKVDDMVARGSGGNASNGTGGLSKSLGSITWTDCKGLVGLGQVASMGARRVDDWGLRLVGGFMVFALMGILVL